MPGVSTYYTFYDDVRVPASSIVLGENEGWKLVTNQLNLERAALGNLGALEPLFRKTLKWAKTTPLDGGKVIDKPWVQQALARVEAQVAAYELLNLRVNASMSSGALSMGEASAAKVFGTELTQQVARELLEVVGQDGFASRLGGATQGRTRARLPPCRDQHLRRRCQRTPARHHRHGRPRHAASTARHAGFGELATIQERNDQVSDDAKVALRQRLDDLIGKPVGSSKPAQAPDPVNAAMIRHWAYALSDLNPAYLDPEFAEGSRYGEHRLSPGHVAELDHGAAQAGGHSRARWRASRAPQEQPTRIPHRSGLYRHRRHQLGVRDGALSEVG